MRPTEGKVSVFGIDGTAIQWPFCFPRYSTAALGLPYLPIKVAIRSSAGSHISAFAAAYQLGWPTMSCPERA